MHAEPKTNGPEDRAAPPPRGLPTSTDERSFLLAQEAEARAALTRARRKLARDLIAAVDVRAWTAEHPLPSLGIAAAAGFVASGVTAPGAKTPAAEVPRQRAALRPGWTSSLVAAAIDIVRSVLVSWLTATPTAPSPQPADQESHAARKQQGAQA